MEKTKRKWLSNSSPGSDCTDPFDGSIECLFFSTSGRSNGQRNAERTKDWNTEWTEWQAWFHIWWHGRDGNENRAVECGSNEGAAMMLFVCFIDLVWNDPRETIHLRDREHANNTETERALRCRLCQNVLGSEWRIFQRRFVYLHVRLNPTWVSVSPATDCNLRLDSLRRWCVEAERCTSASGL